MSFKLDPRRPVGEDVIRAVREQLATTARCVRLPRAPVPDRVHRGRMTCKKARAALKLLRAPDRADHRRENRRLRDAARTLSAWRDAEVALLCWRQLRPHATKTLPPKKFAAVLRALAGHRRATLPSRRKIERTLTRFADQLEAVAERLARWQQTTRAAAMLDEHQRAYKRARAGLAEVRDAGTATTFHEWRKVVKTYAYQCRLLRAAWPPAMKELHRELKQLGAWLGDEHDLTLLRKTLRRLRAHGQLDDAAVFAAALGAIATRRDELRAAAVSLGRRLFADRPRTIGARMRQWWRLARTQAEASLASTK